MTLQEKYMFERESGEFVRVVKQIRSNMNYVNVVDLARLLLISVDNCQSVIDTINAHPDWDNEQVADEIYWDD